jgi:hypothetical protein
VRRFLFPAMLLSGLAMVAIAQSQQEPTGAKKTEPEKTGVPAKEKAKDKDKDAGKAKSEKPKLPPGTIVMSSEDLEKAWPYWIYMPLDKYQAMQDELAALKQQLKEKAKSVHACELVGKLEGDYLALRAEFTFSTDAPRVTMLLGLQGAQLTEKGDLDGQSPLLDYTPEEGFTVRVDKPGSQHRLLLHFRVPVVSQRPAGSSAVERSIELGLPGIAIMPLALDLPAAVKEVRLNDTQEKPRAPGKWLVYLDRKKKLNLSWRESVPQPGAGPHLTAEGKIKVNVRDTYAELSAELILEDPRGQTKECQLVLPPQADVKDVKLDAPPGVPHEWIAPGPKNPNYILRFLEPNAERWVVTAFVKVPRPAPGARLPIGPFFVQGAEHQRGTITVLSPEAPGPQRLIYHRFGDVFQRDPPKAPDVEAVFQYWGMPNPAKAKAPGSSRVPLELELKAERGPLEATADQVVKLRQVGEGWEIDLSARVQVKSPFGGTEFIDLQLPVPAQEFQISEEGVGRLETSQPDAQGRCRVALPRSLGKTFTLTIAGKYAVEAQNHRVRVGLPRVLGVAELVSKVTIQTDESHELLVGDRGFEEPVPEKHRYQFAPREPPVFLDLAWRPYRPDFAAEALVDVVIHSRTARVHQRLSFGPPPRFGAGQMPRSGQVQLQVPAAVKRLTLVRGERPTPLQAENGRVWVPLDGADPKEIVLEYDVAITGAPGPGAADQPRTLEVATVWPGRATRLGAKLRVWCDPGTRVRLADEGPAGAVWQDRGVEPVPGHDLLPSLVLRGDGTQLPLTLRLDETVGSGVASMLCERALIQAVLGEDDTLAMRARYLAHKFGVATVDVEFPIRVVDCQLKVSLGEHAVAWEPVEGVDNVARIKLQGTGGGQPIVLDIRYKLPPSTQDGRFFGIATLIAPVFRDPVEVVRVRWQLSLPSPAVAVPVSPGARLDYRWGLLYGWLPHPEPAASSSELESWLTGKNPVGEPVAVSVSFARAGAEPQRVLHQPRTAWVLLCSVPLVVLFLVLYFLRLSRAGVAVVFGLIALGGLVLALICPALLPALFYGSQPALLVIVLMLVVLWLLQERYRRQLVFIPGFARLQPGSPSSHGSKIAKRPRDASTIDAPVPSGVVGQATTTAKK